MLVARRTAGIDKARHMPARDPGIGALKGLGAPPFVKLPHHSGASIPLEGIR
jgi:hypothetical protein